jgi:Na+/melibiose symporter-like transporter
LRAPPPKRRFNWGLEFREIRAALANRGVLAMLACGFFGAMAAGVISTLSVYFYSYYWGLSTNQISLLVFSILFSAALALGVAPAITRRMDKKRGAIIIALAALVLAPGPVALRLCGWFVDNSSPALLPLLLLFTLIVGAMTLASSALVTSMLADTVEENEIQTRQRTEGLYFAAAFFIQKCVSGLGIFIASLILAWVKFPEGARPDGVAPEVLRNLAIAYIPVVVVLFGLSIACISFYRIGRAAHNANLELLRTLHGKTVLPDANTN